MFRPNLSLACAAALAISSQSLAAVLYSDNFDVDHSANWQYSSSVSGDTAAQSDKGGAGDAFFDYSTVGIPAAPGGASTRGLRVQANINTAAGSTTGALMGMNMSPIGLALPSTYTLTFDCWQNFNGPAPGGGNGSTHLTKVSIGASGTNAEFTSNPINGVQFSATGDGGSSVDYRAYTSTFPNGAGAVLSTAQGVYAAGTQVSANTAEDAYYSSLGGATIPATQTALTAVQNGSAAAGAPAFKWHRWTIVKNTSSITWSMDGKLIATIGSSLLPSTFGNNIGFGQADINATASSDVNSVTYQFGLIDNVVVDDVVPEPASLGLLGLGALFLRRRR